MECIDTSDEEFRREIDYQLELVSKINAANSQNVAQNSQADLFNLEQSLIKMTKNEIFLENFKSSSTVVNDICE